MLFSEGDKMSNKQKTLQQKFLTSFAGQVLSSKEIFSWFTDQFETLPDRSAVHRMLINPLLYLKALTRLHQGLYRVNSSPILAKAARQALEAENTWQELTLKQRKEQS